MNLRVASRMVLLINVVSTQPASEGKDGPTPCSFHFDVVELTVIGNPLGRVIQSTKVWVIGYQRSNYPHVLTGRQARGWLTAA